MLIPIVSCANSSELFLLELQGKLETLGDLSGATLGTISLESNTPTLRIGSSVLQGTQVQLAKPLALLHNDGNGKMQITHRFQSKYLFSKRPQTIVEQ